MPEHETFPPSNWLKETGLRAAQEMQEWPPEKQAAMRWEATAAERRYRGEVRRESALCCATRISRQAGALRPTRSP